MPRKQWKWVFTDATTGPEPMHFTFYILPHFMDCMQHGLAMRKLFVLPSLCKTHDL